MASLPLCAQEGRDVPVAGGREAKRGFTTDRSGADNGRTDFDAIFGGAVHHGTPRRLASDGIVGRMVPAGIRDISVPVHRSCARRLSYSRRAARALSYERIRHRR